MQLGLHAAVVSGAAPDTVLLLEHPPVYTFGRRGGAEFLLETPEELKRLGADVVQTDRGGLVTFHGPGQLVGYPILNLARLRISLKDYVEKLLTAIADALVAAGVRDARADMERPGVFVAPRKIAAVGVRMSRGATYHGFAVNLTTDLSWFSHIVPCGLAGVAATSVANEIGGAPDPWSFGQSVCERLAARLGMRCRGDAPADEPCPS